MVKAIRGDRRLRCGPAEPTVAWSSSAASTSLPKAGTNSRSISSAVKQPAAAVAEHDLVVRRNGQRAGADRSRRALPSVASSDRDLR